MIPVHCQHARVYLLTLYLILLPAIYISSQTISVNDSLERLSLQHQRKGEYDSAIHTKRILFSRYNEINDFDKQIESLLFISECYRKLNLYEQALQTLDSAIGLSAKSSSGDHILSLIFQQAGTVYMSINQFDTAKFLLDKSIQYAITNNPNNPALARTYNNLGNYFFYKRQADSALAYYLFSYEISGSQKDSINQDFASATQNIGIIYATKGQYSMAENFMLTSLSIKEKLYGVNSISLAGTLYNLANFYISISNLDSAYASLQKAENIYRKHFSSDHPELAKIYFVKSNLLITEGDYEKALYYLKNALNIYKDNEDAYGSIIQTIVMNIGFTYERKGDLSEAISFYQRALNDENSPNIVKAYRNLARLYSKMGDYTKANAYFERSINSAKDFYGNTNQDIGLCYQYYGESLLKQGEKEAGLQNLFKAKKVFKNVYGKNNRDYSKILKEIGNYFKLEGVPDSALYYYQQSLIASLAGFDDPRIEVNPSIDVLETDLVALEAMVEKAYVLYLKYRHDENDLPTLLLSNDTYGLAHKMIDSLRNTYQTDESKLILSNAYRLVVNNFLAVSHDLLKSTGDPKYLNQFIELAEVSKSSLLVDAIQKSQAEDIGQVSSSLLSDERSLQLNIGFYNDKIYRERQKTIPDSVLIDSWNSTLFELRVKLEELKQRMEAEYPVYYDLKYKDESTGISEIRSYLVKGESLIEYVLADTVMYIILINETNAKVLAEEIDSSFYRSMDIVNSLIRNSPSFSYTTSDFGNFVANANKLFNHLIKPVREDLTGDQVLIVPDGELNFISFDLLLSDTVYSTHDNYKDLNYLMNDYIIRYSYSTSLPQLRPDKKKAETRIIAFAPDYSPDGNAIKDNGDAQRHSLLPLPYAVEEVQRILEFFPGDKYLLEEATEEVFMEDSPHFGIIHLAMHTLIDNENPLFSKLVFSGQNEGNRDGYLNIYELYSMKMKGEMAVLSACNTGYGKIETGEGVMSLARAFFYAGIPSVVMTLWTVDDKSGADIMAGFYENLADGQEKDIALNRAKIDYLAGSPKIKSHPYYWAGYVCIGDDGSLPEPRKHNIVLIVSGSIALFVLSVYLYIARRRNKTRHS